MSNPSLDKEVELVMSLLNKTSDSPSAQLPDPPLTREIKSWQELSEHELQELVESNLTLDQIKGLRQLLQSVEPCDGNVNLKHPFSMIIAGPSQSGKSSLTRKILESDIITPAPQKVIWAYAEWQPLYDDMKKTGLVDYFVEGLEFEELVDGMTPTLLVIDDLQDEASCDKTIADWFKRKCHHRNLSIIFIVQNLFFQGKKSVDISRNAHYVIVFKNPSDKRQINTFAQKSFPGHIPFITQLYSDVCSKAHGYLLFDFTQTADEAVRIRTGITKGEKLQCFVPS